MNRDEFLAMVAALATRPFPERYLAYRRIRPAPYETPPMGRIANDENLALILVMSENFPNFGVKRMGAILHWPNIKIHHILQRGASRGHVVKASASMYQAVRPRELLAKLQSPPV
ncbi:MAG: hypothetical protein LC620_08975 [Halobacteriales archaeon]|nr:hypothetical protein [Halobacteriales archaeon]